MGVHYLARIRSQHPQMACKAQSNLNVFYIHRSIRRTTVKKMKICPYIMWNVTQDHSGTIEETVPLNNLTLHISLTTVSSYMHTSIQSYARKSGLIPKKDPPKISFLPLHMNASEREVLSLVFHSEYWSLCWVTVTKPYSQSLWWTVCKLTGVLPTKFTYIAVIFYVKYGFYIAILVIFLSSL